MKEVTLLLTATVNPGTMSFTELKNPRERESQYLLALKFWLENTNLKIVFVENSGADLSSNIEEKYKQRIEFLCFKGNDYPSYLGKGYGEMNCIKYFVDNSNFFTDSDFIFKVSGRYRIKNFNQFLLYYLKDPNVFTYLDIRENLTNADSKIFGCDPGFLSNYLIKRQNEVNDTQNIIFEKVLARAVLESIIQGKRFKQFPFHPNLLGVSGTLNKRYKNSFFYFLRKKVEFFLKEFLMRR